MPDSLRLFIALELPLTVQDRLQALQERLDPLDTGHTVRWTAIDAVHLTIKFLGETPTDQFEEIELSVIDAARALRPFQLNAEGVGAFPNPMAPQTVWAGVGGDRTALLALRSAIEAAIAPLGYPTDARPFEPHLTLGRIKTNARRVGIRAFGERLAALDVGAIAAWPIETVNLMRSELQPGNAVYTRLVSARLGG